MAIFDIPNDDIRNLDEIGLPKLVYQIMYYEIGKLNLLNQGLHISLNTKTGDGGSDGEFNCFNKPIPEDHPFLPNGNIVFQFKAASIGDKAWFENEILLSDKSDLKPKLKELIADNYTYILITNKTDLPTKNLEIKEVTLKEIFQNLGYRNIEVKIIDLTKLSEWANSIPQIYLTLTPSTKYFESFENYIIEIKESSENLEYFNDEVREKEILQIQTQIETTMLSGKSSFIRIEGFSGIGKTRFVFESLNDEKFKDFVLYVQIYRNEVLTDLVTFCKKLPENSKELIIFVIDECPYDEHTQICRKLKNYPNIVVITIDQVLSLQDKVNCKEEYRVRLEGLSDEKTIELIHNTNPILPTDIKRKIAHFTEGYPRLAKFMAESYDIEKGDTSDADNKNYLLDKILDKVTNNSEERKLLKAISIFKMFPNTDELRTYKTIIFEHFKIDSSLATETIDKLTKKGIVRKAGRFLYISPRPISVHLFNKFLESYDYDFIDELFKKLNNEGLMNSFFDKLQGIPFDSSQHKELLYQVLSSLTYEQIDNEFGAKIFYSLCLKDKKYSLLILNRLFEGKTTEDLLKFEDGRRYIVFALEQLISFKETFDKSAKILFKLARAENESWGNNSKGIFVGSFQLVLGGTEVNIVNRLALLQQLYQFYTEDQDRKILFEALENAYPKLHYSATHKNHPNIPENIPDHYYPTTQEEINNYFEKLKEVILFYYENSPNTLQPYLLNEVISSLRSFLLYSEIGLWVLNFIENEVSHYDQIKSHFFEEVSFALKYDKDENLPKDVLLRLEEINEQFFNVEKTEDIKGLLFTTPEYKYNSEEDFLTHVQLVINDILINRNFHRLLDKRTENTFIIGKKLAELDTTNLLYEDIINLIPTVDQTKDIRFIKTYLLANIKQDKDYKGLLNEVYSKLQDKSLLFDFLHSMNPKNQAVVNYLYILLEKNEIKTSHLEHLTYGFWLRDLSKAEFTSFIDHINLLTENKCDSFDLCMQYLLHADNKDKNLIEKYTIYYIENDIFKCTNQHRIHYHIDNLTDVYFSYGLALPKETLKKVWEAILYEFDDDAKFEKREFGAIYKIIQHYPEFFWKKIKNTLDELKPARYPLYSNFVTFMQGGYMSRWFTHSIFNFINPEEVVSWLKSTQYEKAKYIVADSFNIDFKSDILPEIVINILTEFPNDENLYFSISCSSESWSGSYVTVANEKIHNIDVMLERYKDIDSVVDFLKWAKKSFEYSRERALRDDEERNLFD